MNEMNGNLALNFLYAQISRIFVHNIFYMRNHCAYTENMHKILKDLCISILW